jgi:hypothetical protein
LETPDVAPSSKLRKAMSGKPGGYVGQGGGGNDGVEPRTEIMCVYLRLVWIVFRVNSRTTTRTVGRRCRLFAEASGAAVDQEHGEEDAAVDDLAAGLGHLEDGEHALEEDNQEDADYGADVAAAAA